MHVTIAVFLCCSCSACKDYSSERVLPGTEEARPPACQFHVKQVLVELLFCPDADISAGLGFGLDWPLSREVVLQHMPWSLG